MRAPAHFLVQQNNTTSASSSVTGLNNSQKTLNLGAGSICAIAFTRALSASRRVLVVKIGGRLVKQGDTCALRERRRLLGRGWNLEDRR
jgi:hypothetical protein